MSEQTAIFLPNFEQFREEERELRMRLRQLGQLARRASREDYLSPSLDIDDIQKLIAILASQEESDG